MYKTYQPFDPFTPYDANSLLRQGLIVVASAGERDQIDTPTEGMHAYRFDTHLIERFTGTAWKILASRPVLTRLTVKAGQGFTTADTAFSWDERIDTDAFHNDEEPTKVRIPYRGLYEVSWALISSGVVAVDTWLRKNGTGTSDDALLWTSAQGVAGAGTSPAASTVETFEAGDVLELMRKSPTAPAATWRPIASNFTIRYLGDI